MNLFLETFNGSFGILALITVAVLALHILDMIIRGGPPGARLRIGWWKIAPDGLRLAVGCFLIALSEAVTRPAVWQWRATTCGRMDMLWVLGPILAVGAVIGCIGFLVIIQVTTSARYGRQWPWLVSLALVLAFIVGTLLMRLGWPF